MTTLKITRTVTALAVKTDGTSYSIQAEGWRGAAAQVLDAHDRQQEDIRRGFTKVRFSKVFLSYNNVLEEHTISQLRIDLDSEEIPEGPFNRIDFTDLS